MRLIFGIISQALLVRPSHVCVSLAGLGLRGRLRKLYDNLAASMLCGCASYGGHLDLIWRISQQLVEGFVDVLRCLLRSGKSGMSIAAVAQKSKKTLL